MSNDTETAITQAANTVPTPPSPSSPHHKRRASLADLFRPSDAAPRSFPSAMSQVQPPPSARRLSITTLGLSGATTQGQPSPFSAARDRGRSLSGEQANRRSSIYENGESAIAEDGDAVPPMSGSSPGSAPGFHRRLSAGAKAYSDMRRGSGGNSGSVSFSSGSSSNGASRVPASPPTKRDGFNWSETLRTRAERSSVSAGSGNANGLNIGNVRGPSQPSTAAVTSQPVPQQAKPPPQKPDAFQERILKGDFYMD